MSKPAHFNILIKGHKEWNKWRIKHPDIQPDLSGHRFVFVESNLRRYSKPGLNTTTYGAFMRYDLSNYDFSEVDFSGCVFWENIFHRTNLTNAILKNTEFRQCDFYETNLEGANLRHSTFVLTKFNSSKFQAASFEQSHFAYSPLQNCSGLNETVHYKMGHIDFLTMVHSNSVAYDFAKNFGINFEEYTRVKKLEPKRFFDCFISYNRHDEKFVEALRKILLLLRVPCWFAPSDYRINTEWNSEPEEYELRRDLYNVLDACDVVILIVSNNSMKSKWVKSEVGRVKNQRVVPILLENIEKALEAKTRWLEIFGYIDFRGRANQTELFQKIKELMVYLVRK